MASFLFGPLSVRPFCYLSLWAGLSQLFCLVGFFPCIKDRHIVNALLGWFLPFPKGHGSRQILFGHVLPFHKGRNIARYLIGRFIPFPEGQH